MSLNHNQQRWAELVAAGYSQSESCRMLKLSVHTAKDYRNHPEIKELIEKLTAAKKVTQKAFVADPQAFVVAELLERLEVAKNDRIPRKQRNGQAMKDQDGNVMYTAGDTSSILKILDQLAKVWKLYETTKVEVNLGFNEVMKMRQQALEADQTETVH